jgi:hypothetical protein
VGRRLGPSRQDAATGTAVGHRRQMRLSHTNNSRNKRRRQEERPDANAQTTHRIIPEKQMVGPQPIGILGFCIGIQSVRMCRSRSVQKSETPGLAPAGRGPGQDHSEGGCCAYAHFAGYPETPLACASLCSRHAFAIIATFIYGAGGLYAGSHPRSPVG